MENLKQEKPVRATINGLKVGECATFSLDKKVTVVTTRYQIATQYQKKFNTKTNAAARTITVTRIA